jgi:hypothetical protein
MPLIFIEKSLRTIHGCPGGGNDSAENIDVDLGAVQDVVFAD